MGEPRLCFQPVLCTLGVTELPGLGRKPELEGRLLMGGLNWSKTLDDETAKSEVGAMILFHVSC